MNILKTVLFYYSFFLSIILFLGGISTYNQTSFPVPILIILPITVYFIFSILSKLRLINKNRLPLSNFLPVLFIYWGFVITAIMTITGLIGAGNIAQLISAVLFLPITLYFTTKVIPKRKKAVLIPQIVILPEKTKRKDAKIIKRDIFEVEPDQPKKLDVNRRQFIKLIGSAGLTLFLFSIFTKKAQAAFFGSVPGPGTVALKDTAGVQIDPAQLHPTDGYKISQIDDSSPAYYGFVRKDGAWFIMKEDSSGNYRYAKGTSSFSTNWTNRASLTYDYFDVIF